MWIWASTRTWLSIAAWAPALRLSRARICGGSSSWPYCPYSEAMTSGNTPEPDVTLFSAVITPHRSLTGIGFLVLMAAIGGVSFVAGIVFLILGAWPVM